jgi:hypothetical protein
MFVTYCLSCQRRTGFRAHYGFIGTLLMLLITCGLWLFALPFYPKHCVACGCVRPGLWTRSKHWWGGDPKPPQMLPQIFIFDGETYTQVAKAPKKSWWRA